MRKIHYAGTTVTTDDVLAGEVEEYAAELARHGTADTITVPGLGPDGVADEFDLLIGPASQLLIGTASEREEQGERGELDTDDAVAELRRRRSALRSAPVAVTDQVRNSMIDDY